LLARLDRDLPGPGPALPAFQGAALDPLAVDYLVLGSRLGTEVLRRHLADAAPALPMPAYFRAPPATAEWRALCQHLDQINPESDRAARILFDAGRGFGIFTAAAQAVLPPQPGTETRA
jgi:heme oxygenase